jgi:hypothetical protein
MFMIRNKTCFYGEELSEPRPTPKLEDHPLSAVGDCLIDIFGANLQIRGRSSIRTLRTRHAVVTGTLLSWTTTTTTTNTVTTTAATVNITTTTTTTTNNNNNSK